MITGAQSPLKKTIEQNIQNNYVLHENYHFFPTEKRSHYASNDRKIKYIYMKLSIIINNVYNQRYVNYY